MELVDLERQWTSSNDNARTKNEQIKRRFDADHMEILNQKRSVNVDAERQHLLSQKISEFVKSRLKNEYIIDASIANLGKDLKMLLMQDGIVTAADLEGMSVDNLGIAYIIRSDRWPLHVPGIGPAKAAELLLWKQNLEDKYTLGAKVVLTPQENAAIEAILRRKTEEFSAKETTLRGEYATRRQKIREECQNEHTRLRQQVMINTLKTREKAEALQLDLQSKYTLQRSLTISHVQKRSELVLADTQKRPGRDT
jgi:hypothetical protein